MVMRRQVLKGVGVGAFALGGCAAAPAAAPVVAAAVPTASAAAGWFADVAVGVAATLIAETFKEAFKAGWEAFQGPTNAAIQKQEGDGYGWFTKRVWGHEIPQASFIACHVAEAADPLTDRLVMAHVEVEPVVFDSWAWRGILAFTRGVTEGKKGDDLLHLKQLLAKTVLPAGAAFETGTTRNGTASWITYPARDGEVEVVMTKTEGSVDKVTVTTTGFFTESYGKPMLRSFELA